MQADLRQVNLARVNFQRFGNLCVCRDQSKSVSFNPDGSLLATGDVDKVSRVVDGQQVLT